MIHKKFRSFIFHMALLSFLSLGLAAQSRAAGVSLSATPTTQTVTVGQTAAYTIKINRDNYADKVTLSATGLPAGVTATFNPNVTTLSSSTLKLQTAAATPIGTFNINVKGSANGITIAPLVVKLITQPAPSISVSIKPSAQFIVAGQSTFYDVAVSRFNFDDKLTFSAQNLPSGVTALFEPESTYGNSSRMYLFSNGLPFISKDYSIAVRAFGNGIDKLTFVELRANYGILWAAQFGVPDNNSTSPDFATDVTYDAAGNVYLTGYTFTPATADRDTWIAKLNPAGNLLWVRVIYDLVAAEPTDVFVDAAGNVYAAGFTQNGGNQVNFDIFVVKLDANGAQSPLISLMGTPNEEGKSGMQFGVDSAGNTTLTAVTRVARQGAGTDVDGVPLKHVTYEITRYAFDANFHRTSFVIVPAALGDPKDLAVGADDSVYVLSDDHETRNNAGELWVASMVEKFNSPSGQNYLSPRIAPSMNGDYFGSRLKVKADGSVFAVGNVIHRSFPNFVPVATDSWRVKLDPASQIAWLGELSFGANLTDIKSLDIDSGGNVYYAGLTWDSLRGVNPNAGSPDDELNPQVRSRTDAWFAKYSGVNGTQLFLSQFNVNDHDAFNVVRVGPGGALYFAGYTLNFTNMNYGQQDALLLRCSSLFCNYTP